MTTPQIAQQLVDLCRKGEFMQAINSLYSADIVSVEPMAMPPMPAEIKGIDAVNKKGEWWTSNHTIHSCTVGGPFVNGDKFVVTFDMDVTNKPSNKRMKMAEAGVYTVANGKVIHEAFYYAPQPGMK